MKARTIRPLALLVTLATLLAGAQAHAQCAGWEPGPLDDGTVVSGTNGNVYAAIAWDPDGAGSLAPRLVIAGNFTSVQGVPALNIAQRDPVTGVWQAVGTGIAPTVRSLTVFNGQLVAGCEGDNNVGTFDVTVRRWDGLAWQNFPATNTGTVYVMEVYSGVLYIGGSFMTQFVTPTSVPAYYIAKYNPGADKWEDVDEAGFGTETNTSVRAFAAYGGELYVGGWKKSAASITGSAIHVTHGNSPTGFTAITTGTDPGAVNDLAVFAGELVIAGGFNTLNGVTRNNVCAWNGSSIHGFSTGTGATGVGMPVAINRAIVHSSGLAIGGQFTTASGNPANRVAFWPSGGSAWQALGGGTDDDVQDLVSYNGKLVAVGDFLVAERPAAHMAYWDGVAWNSFGGGTGSYVLSLLQYNGRIVAGGNFHQSTADLSSAHNIAGWYNGSAQSFGSGVNSDVFAMETFKYSGVFGSYELLAGGTFTVAGGVAANRIARWNERNNVIGDTPAWAAMGPGFNNAVYAIARFNGITYAAGAFTASGATAVNRIAKWNETTKVWEPLGTGLNGFCYALKVYNGALYVGGNFSTAGGITTGGLARWDGSSWSAVGTAFLDGVLSFEVYNGNLVIGGQFSAFAGNPNIIQYNGSSFSPLGSGGANNNVRAVRANGTRLYASGDFSSIGGVTASRIAYFDGSWHDLHFGADNIVFALGSFNNEVHAGGSFINVNWGGSPIGILHAPFWARYSETGLPWFSQQPFSRSALLGDDVSFTAQPVPGYGVTGLQWYHNDVPMVDGPTGNGSTVVGATTGTLTILDAVWNDHGNYKMGAINSCGTAFTNTVTLTFTGVTAAPSPGERFATVFEALGPNPAGGASQIAFSLAGNAAVGVRVHDVRGRLVRALQIGRLPAGRHTTRWDARDNNGQRVGAGQYFVSVEVDGRTIGSKRLTILH
jgi:hypothetical protein